MGHGLTWTRDIPLAHHRDTGAHAARNWFCLRTNLRRQPRPTGGASSTGGTPATGGAKNTGGTAATGSTGNGGTSAYNPCPTSRTLCKVLPLGDSITYGLQSSDGGGYREPLFKLAVAANQKITFTGSLTNGPASVTVNGTTVAFPANNEGHSGWTIDQIAGLVPSPAMDTIPNIVLLMAGTNDVYAPAAPTWPTSGTRPSRPCSPIDRNDR